MRSRHLEGPDGIVEPVPVVRFTEWSMLDESIRQQVTDAFGYDEVSWNYPGTSLVEQEIQFDNLNKAQQTVANVMDVGVKELWDCWQHHYWDYNWQELPNITKEGFELLGWTEDKWTYADPVPAPTENKKWKELTEEERHGAWKICFFQETWDGEGSLWQQYLLL